MDKKNSQVDALNLERVKDVMKLNLKPNHVLVEVVKKDESGLILPEHAQAKSGKMIILKVGDNVKGVNVGDVIVSMKFTGDIDFVFKDKSNYIITDVYNIMLTTSVDNYE